MSCRMRSVKKVLRNYLASKRKAQREKQERERERMRVLDKDKELPQAAGKNSFSLKSLLCFELIVRLTLFFKLSVPTNHVHALFHIVIMTLN